MKPIKLSFLIFFLTTFLFVKPALACDTSYCARSGNCSGVCSDCYWCNYEEDSKKITNPVLPGLTKMTGIFFLGNFLRTGIQLVLIAGSVIFFFILISGGIKWLSSSGDKVKLESAQKQISSGLVGLAILLSSFAVIKLIEALFGIDLLNITLPTL